ncbi:integrase core domain-containing protein [Nocardia sp. CY41]|uniref:integrase core domain-containing protein n=1 Tax=Nocardia sp. CY41 TaxID=2608686 RepID=UPI003FA5D7C2
MSRRCCSALATSASTPTPHGKVKRYHRILAEEFLYAREWASETQRTDALGIWNIHYNDHRPHTAAENQPPASRLHTGVTNVPAHTARGDCEWVAGSELLVRTAEREVATASWHLNGQWSAGAVV